MSSLAGISLLRAAIAEPENGQHREDLAAHVALHDPDRARLIRRQLELALLPILGLFALLPILGLPAYRAVLAAIWAAGADFADIESEPKEYRKTRYIFDGLLNGLRASRLLAEVDELWHAAIECTASVVVVSAVQAALRLEIEAAPAKERVPR